MADKKLNWNAGDYAIWTGTEFVPDKRYCERQLEIIVSQQEAEIKRLRSILEDILEMPLSSETDYILEQNRYFREIAQAALKGE